MLENPLSDKELAACMDSAEGDQENTCRITIEEFTAWWNSEQFNPELTKFKQDMGHGMNLEGSGAVFS